MFTLTVVCEETSKDQVTMNQDLPLPYLALTASATNFFGDFKIDNQIQIHDFDQDQQEGPDQL